MKARPIPAALMRRPETSSKVLQPTALGPAPTPIRLYLAVPDKRFLPVLKQKARVFSSLRSDQPVTLYAFHAPDLPNLPTDDLKLLGTLTEFGDVDGVEIITLTPEPIP